METSTDSCLLMCSLLTTHDQTTEPELSVAKGAAELVLNGLEVLDSISHFVLSVSINTAKK